MSVGRILVVEDHDSERRAISQILKAEDLTVFAAENPDKALSYLDENIDLVLSDFYFGDGETTGMQLLEIWKSKKPDTVFVILTGRATVNLAVEAMKVGASDFFAKPVNPAELIHALKHALEYRQNQQQIENIHRCSNHKFGIEQIVGVSKHIRDVCSRIERVAPIDSNVLITGRSGTGKELVAQALHQHSHRSRGPFVAVNCAAVPSTLVESELFGHVRGAFTGATDKRIGRFEQADGGTLFIDEIGEFELGLQSKLLRILDTLTLTPVGGHEDRKVNVRVLAATSVNLRKRIAAGQFREDLYYRLNVVEIRLSALCKRPDDIPVLVEHFLKEISRKKFITQKRVSKEVMEFFLSYRWRGNVRELQHALESMMILATTDTLTLDDLPAYIRRPNPSLIKDQLRRTS